MMREKKLMLLGGSRYLMPIIDIAHKLDIYVITVDYFPNNIAHQFSDKYVNLSVIDKEAVLSAARNLRIDGIMSFACDPGVVTAAYVAENMGLPFQCSYEATNILQDKGLFRKFLTENGFNCPHAKRYDDKLSPFLDIDYFNWPVIVKPVDSAGSKGITRVDRVSDLANAIEIAVNGSRSGAFIIEDFLIFEGYHSSTDPFTVEGELRFATYSDQLFDPEADNPYTPAFIIWPSTMKEEYQHQLTSEIQRLMKLLNVGTGIYNIETCVANGKPYIMEVSPRGGGCKIAELQRLAYGVDLIEAEVRKAVGLPLDNIVQTECDGHWCEMVIHARPGEEGLLESIFVDDRIRENYLRVTDIGLKKGEYVQPFTGANMALGDIFLRFDSREKLDEVIGQVKNWLHINLAKQRE